MRKILLIEDEDDIRENTAEILELANYKVYTASNGREGIEQALLHRPELVICDIMMPVLDGYGVLATIGQHPELNNPAFIFLTAKSERADMRKGMEMGADDYIVKPFGGAELLNAVATRFRKLAVQTEAAAQDPWEAGGLMNDVSGNQLIKTLAEGRNINHYKKKQVIYSEGNRPSRLFYLRGGKVKAFKSNDDGKELVVDLYRPGDFFGYVALLEETNYTETAEAMEKSEVAVIPKEDFEGLLNGSREVSRQFIKLLANNISNKEERLIGLTYNSLRKKVAMALIGLCHKYGTGGDSGHFSIDIGRDNLATIAGTATESLIRTLGDFRTEKLVEIRSGEIIILNKKGLEQMVN